MAISAFIGFFPQSCFDVIACKSLFLKDQLQTKSRKGKSISVLLMVIFLVKVYYAYDDLSRMKKKEQKTNVDLFINGCNVQSLNSSDVV